MNNIDYLTSQKNRVLMGYLERKNILTTHLQNLQKYQISNPNQNQEKLIMIRINNSLHKCDINRCIKKSSYKYNEKYYCWFHKIDLEMNQ